VTGVLVVNSGSSSLKYQLIDTRTEDRRAWGLVERIGALQSRLVHGESGARSDDQVVVERLLPDHAGALQLVLDTVGAHGHALDDLAGVGHRVVHGGRRFTAPVLVDEHVESEIERLVPLAPLHNPANLMGIRALRRLLPQVPHVAVFDTAFHATIPPMAATYAIPTALTEQHGIRRYGFHGTSVEYVTGVAADLLALPVERVNLVVAHIGNGASITAVQGGRSVDTSMGLSPLEGLVMGTRSGDVDPALAFHLVRTQGMTLDDVDRLLNRESGLLGLAGAGDVREVRSRAAAGDARARAALDVYAYRIRKYVGAYLAAVPGVHAVVFTAGVGENDAALRAEVVDPLAHLGLRIDPAANAAPDRAPRAVDGGGSPVRVLVVPTDEEIQIARHTARTATGSGAAAS
jgi:acetate kinase